MPPATDRPVVQTGLVTYPINVMLGGHPCLVVGGGRVAAGKISGLLAAGAKVTVVAPRILPQLLDDASLTCELRPYRPDDVAGKRLVVTCTDNAYVNAEVAADGAAHGVLVNSADDPANCDFILPAVARRGPIQIGVSTSGSSPALASWMRRRFEQMAIDESWDALVALTVDARAESRRRYGTSEHDGWARAFDDGLADLVAAGRIDDGRRLLRTRLGLT